jgi:hypothetical protein
VEPLLGGDAAPDETSPAGALVDHHGHVETEIVCIQGGGIATWAPADYDDVCQTMPFIFGSPSLVSRGITLTG